MEAIEELLQLSDSMCQGQAILADKDVDENSTASSCRSSTFLNVIALGNVYVSGSQVHPAQEWDMLSFLRSLKSMLRSSNAVVVTFPPSLLSSSSSTRWQHMASSL